MVFNFKQLVHGIISLVFISLCKSQEIPKRSFVSDIVNMSFNNVDNWEYNSIFGPHRYQQKNDHLFSDKNSTIHAFSISTNWDRLYIKHYSLFTFRKYFFAYFDLHFDGEHKQLQGDEDQIILNYSSPIKIDMSGFGYENEWVNIQIGRGRESWGAGERIQIALNNDSPAYDYIKIGSNYGNVRVRCVNAFLEKTNDGYNRYLSARGVEWTNKKSVLVGIHETVIYSGYDRKFEIAYLNPIGSHLEIEWNNRLTLSEKEQASNAVWQLSGDFVTKNNFRISGNILMDDIVIDREIEGNQNNAIAYSLKLSKSHFIKANTVNFYLSTAKVSTSTFRHAKYNNFIVKGKPIGIGIGSDSKTHSIGFTFLRNNKLSFTYGFNHTLSGDRNIAHTPYLPSSRDDSTLGSFPSGNILTIQFHESELKYLMSNKLMLSIRYLSGNKLIPKLDSQLCIGVDYNFMLHKPNTFNYLK